MNKEIEELLDKLKDKDWYDELDLTGTRWIELKQEETNLLLLYIEQLENNRDKAIEYFKFENPEIFKNPNYTNHLWTVDGLTIKRFIDKLKGDSDYE